jgi:hypothetical protein
MKTIIPLFVLAAGISAAALLGDRAPQAHLSHFTWENENRTVHYSFSVENRTSEPMTLLVSLIAEGRKDGRGRAAQPPVGKTRLEIPLTGDERKRLSGTIDVSEYGTGQVALSYTLEVTHPGR